jgi:flagellar hook assembly protein FlgD
MTELPTEFALRDNYPNPFNPATTIKFELPKDAFVNITIYDNLGREVQKLVNSQMEAGYHSVVWDATKFASGVYFYKMNAGDYNRTVKMILVK